MKFIILLGLALLLYGTPAYLMDTLVMSELLSLKEIYGNADALAEQVVSAP